eukprot:5593007-Lingulodinium_polyedra.AAC.1
MTSSGTNGRTMQPLPPSWSSNVPPGPAGDMPGHRGGTGRPSAPQPGGARPAAARCPPAREGCGR